MKKVVTSCTTEKVRCSGCGETFPSGKAWKEHRPCKTKMFTVPQEYRGHGYEIDSLKDPKHK